MRTSSSCALLLTAAFPASINNFVVAFTSPSSASVKTSTSSSKPLTFGGGRRCRSDGSLNVLPGHEFAGGDLDSAVAAAHHAADFVHAHLVSSSTLLADAATDAVADAAAPNKGPGWWQNYLQIFKNALVFVHSTIEQPLKSIGFEQTWGPAIAIFTFCVRGLLVPLSVQQSKSAEYMKALKPYQDEIKQKFEGRQELQNRAIAKLYEDADQNPLAGCLVSLAQLPIFLGLYRAVRLLAQDGKLDEPFLWIPSLEGPVTAPTYRGLEWLTEGWSTPVDGGLPVPHLGWETTLAFLVMPVILVLGQSFTMSTLAPNPDENATEEEKQEFEKSQRILKFLPLMIGFFSLQVPAGLTIYWFASNLFTLTQSLTVKAYYKANPPQIELPDYWDALDDVANMSPEERRQAAEAGIAAGPDFETLMDEAKYHYVVERTPLRAESAAWSRVEANGGAVPEQMSSWVASGSVLPPPSEHKDVAHEVKSIETGEAESVEAANV